MITAQRLDTKTFAPYGRFVDMLSRGGDKLGNAPIEFFKDRIQQSLGEDTCASFSTCGNDPRPFVVDVLECHRHCEEVLLPLDNDMLLQVASMCSVEERPDVAQLEVFIVPQGTLVNLSARVWHHAPFALNGRRVNILISLPEETYRRDACTYDLKAEECVEIQVREE